MNKTLDAPATLRDYLLRNLDEGEQERVEERILSDKEFGRRVAMAQDDLIDDYVAGNLSGPDLESFRRHFTLPPARAEKLKFAAALHRYVSEREPSAARGPVTRARDSLRANPLRAAAYTAAALAVVAALLFVLNLGVERLWRGVEFGRELARLNSAQGPGTDSLREIRSGPPGSLTLTLRQNLVREDSGSRRAELTRGVTVIRLLLEVASGPHDSYRAVLQSGDGGELAAVENLKAREDDGAQFVLVNLPAEFLRQGSYQVKLMGLDGGGRATEVGLYPFEVTIR
jgi:hypothetical protein